MHRLRQSSAFALLLLLAFYGSGWAFCAACSSGDMACRAPVRPGVDAALVAACCCDGTECAGEYAQPQELPPVELSHPVPVHLASATPAMVQVLFAPRPQDVPRPTATRSILQLHCILLI